MAGQHQCNARWHLDAPLDLEWRFKASCRLRQDLPWTPDVEPDWPEFSAMRDVCAGCPVLSECAEFGLSQPGGFYAGAWTPYKDGGPRASEESEESERAVRFRARKTLREVRDSATPVKVFNTPRSSKDARSVSLHR